MRSTRSAFAFALLAAASVAGCDDAPSRSGPAASGSASAAPAPAPTPTSPPPPPPDDLDVGALQKTLKCANDSTSGACGVLTKFATCKPWSAVVPSGDGRWIGRGWSVEAGKPSEAFVALRVRRVGTSEVGPGQLPARVAIEELPKGDKQLVEAAERMVRILERQDVAPRFNAALDYVTKRSEWTESYATRTTSGQVDVLTSGGAFVCEGPKHQLVVVSRGASRSAATSADGLYAEVWPTTW